ncbi:MAG: glycosyltransferase [Hyphomonadaceae bacterium]
MTPLPDKPPLEGSHSPGRIDDTVLIVSPHFPPSTLAGVHRARHLAKHLPAHGWRPVVIRVAEEHYTETHDPAILLLTSPTVEQVRTRAMPANLSRAFGIGDIGLRAYAALGSAIAKAARRENAKAILITGAPFYPMLLAGRLRQQLRLPVVLDFQDPWVSAEGATRAWLSKGRMAHRLSLALEPHAVRSASWITSVSQTQNDEMADRYSWLDRKRMSAIPIGGDPEDFVISRGISLENRAIDLDTQRFNLCYVGTFLPRAGPIVRTMFMAAALLKQERPDLAAKLRFVFVGTSNQPQGRVASASAHRVLPIATEVGVDGMVEEYPARVPFAEALRLNANADGLMLLGSDEPHYTASKIYPALMSGRPYISLFHAQSSSHDILSRSGGGATFAFNDLAQLPNLAPAIAGMIVRMIESPESFGKADTATYAPYTAQAIAGEFADVLRKAAS